jgi:hypothetical protein
MSPVSFLPEECVDGFVNPIAVHDFPLAVDDAERRQSEQP